MDHVGSRSIKFQVLHLSTIKVHFRNTYNWIYFTLPYILGNIRECQRIYRYIQNGVPFDSKSHFIHKKTGLSLPPQMLFLYVLSIL